MSALNRRTTALAPGRRAPPFSRMPTASVSPLARFSKASLAMLSKRVCANTRLSRSPSHSIRPPARSASAGRVRVTNWNARTSAWRESSPAIDLSLRLPKPAISTGHHHGSLRSACGDLSGRPNLTRTVRARFRRRTSLSRRSAMMLPSLLGRHTLSSSIRLTKVGQRRRGRRRIPEDSPNRGAPGVLCTHVVRHDALQVVAWTTLVRRCPSSGLWCPRSATPSRHPG